MNSLLSIDKLRLIMMDVTGLQLSSLDIDQDLYDSNILDSFALFQLIPALESSFGCHIGEKYMSQSNFSTLSAIHLMLLDVLTGSSDSDS